MQNSLPKIFYITYRFTHHNVISSYPCLPLHVQSTNVVTPWLLSRAFDRFANGALRHRLVEETGLTGYVSEALWLECWSALIAKMPQRSVIHYIHPENSYYFLSKIRRHRRCKLVASFHQPVPESRTFILKTDPIRRLDAVIMLSETQREFFEPLVGRDRLFVVPHGVNTQYFMPPANPRRERRLMSVGSWLRDFPTLIGAMRILRERAPDVVLDVVASAHHRSTFSGLDNVCLHAGITDEELIALYHRTSIAVMSLTAAVANQGLLESMAVGLPLVATDLPSVREYTTAEGCRYVEAVNPEHLAETIISMLDDPVALARMGSVNREFVVRRFDWDVIARQMEAVYRTINPH